MIDRLDAGAKTSAVSHFEEWNQRHAHPDHRIGQTGRD
jgi:hypothetical protein